MATPPDAARLRSRRARRACITTREASAFPDARAAPRILSRLNLGPEFHRHPLLSKMHSIFTEKIIDFNIDVVN